MGKPLSLCWCWSVIASGVKWQQHKRKKCKKLCRDDYTACVKAHTQRCMQDQLRHLPEPLSEIAEHGFTFSCRP